MRIRMLALMFATAAALFAQGNTAPINGAVTDPAGAAVPGAAVEAQNVETGVIQKTTSDGRGDWTIPLMPAGTYRVSVTAPGFRKTTMNEVKMNAGIPVTVNARLEIGQTTETIEVSAGAELVQTTSATVASSVQQRQVQDLPFTSRGGMDLLVTQPGVQTGTTSRNSFINGLPFAAMSVTIDGINTQDNYYKNGDGFFTLIPARQDSLEEITLSTSAAGADANAQGAAQVKFTTKGGTNEYHGGTFWQHRNTALNANSYFNNINRLPRNRVILNQGGFNLGGPILRNKLFFFTNYELYRYPAQTTTTRVVMNQAALNGDFTYPVSGGTRTVNLLQLALDGGFPSTADPIIGKTLNQINGYTRNGTLQSRVSSNSDYTRSNLIYQPKGLSKYWTDTTRIDYHVTAKHMLTAVYTYYKNSSVPDITNSVVPIFPGTGAVIGFDDLVPSQGGNRYALSVALRSVLTSRLTNELRFGLNRGITIFRGEVSSPNLFEQWRGYYPTLGFGLTTVASVSGSSRRTSPVRELHETMSLQKGRHTLSFGLDISQINLWYQTVGTSVIPQISFNGIATNDPVNTGATNIFTTANLPGATATSLSDAGSMYAMMTGRAVSITRSLAFDGTSYKNVPPTERDRQYEWGLFLQDSWRVHPDLTLNMGIRFQQQRPFQNLDGVYSSVTYDSLWGVSGVGNWFAPGVLTGIKPTFDKYNGDYYKIPNSWNPSIGFAWRMPGVGGPLGWIMGSEKGKMVLRAGYAIASVRNGSNTFQSLFGSNQGLNYDAAINPTSYPADFGAPGSVLFRNATLPVRSNVPSAPQYPITPLPTNSLNGYEPNLAMPYVQSWNFGLQRELGSNMVMEVRYTGNRGVKLWRQININELNVFENGFSKEFYVAQKNLFLNRGCRSSWTDCANATNSFANAGLAGQGSIPILTTGLGYTSDTTVANYLRQNRAASTAGLMHTNTAAMNRLTAAGYPVNMFLVNPSVNSGGSWVLNNMGSSNYNALQVEVNRRMSRGLLLQGSYVLSHSLVNGSQSSLVDASQPTTLRNLDLDYVPGGYDIRHAYKINGVWELPFGKGRKYLSSIQPVAAKALEGWSISGIGRWQSGTPFQLTSGRSGMTGAETGVVLNNITMPELQKMVQIRKTTGTDGVGQVYYLPDALITNTNAAFELNGRTWSNLDTTKPYIGPQLEPGQFGHRLFLRNPYQYHLDLAVVKRTTITERVRAELQASFINIMNLTNFFIANGPSSTSFGRTTSAFNDFSGSADPGGRIIEFRLRVSF